MANFNYARKRLQFTAFSKKDIDEHWNEILEQLEAELMIGFREIMLDIKNMVAQLSCVR